MVVLEKRQNYVSSDEEKQDANRWRSRRRNGLEAEFTRGFNQNGAVMANYFHLENKPSQGLYNYVQL